jgi:putative ABC transport system permease protein
MRIPLLAGRSFDASMFRRPRQEAIVDERLARRLWGEANPVGEQLGLIGNAPLRVVGVAAGIRDSGFSGPAAMMVYFPVYPRTGTVVVRGEPDPIALAPAIRAVAAELDPAVGISDVQPMDARVTRWFGLQRFTALLLGILAGVAAFLGVVGLYGVIAFTVSQRTHEIGLRMALGSQRRDVLRLVLGQGTRLALGGVVLGLAGAAGLTRLLSALLFEVSATDPLIFSGVSVILLALAIAACYVPARRAAAVDPLTALRHE